VGKWRIGGVDALRSKGPVSAEKLSARQWARLESELNRGPLAHGFADDQRWTLPRIKTLIGKLFHIGYTIEGVSKLLVYHGRAHEPKSFAWSDYRDLIISVHRQLDAPLVWCWDNLNIHLAAELADFAEANKDWLRLYRFRPTRPNSTPPKACGPC
jgi:hypothetical protein